MRTFMLSVLKNTTLTEKQDGKKRATSGLRYIKRVFILCRAFSRRVKGEGFKKFLSRLYKLVWS